MHHWLQHVQSGQLGNANSWRHGEYIFHCEDPAESAYVLTNGVVEIVHDTPDGHSLVVKLLVAPTFFGHVEAMACRAYYLESVRALGRASAHVIKAEHFATLVRENAALSCEVLTDTCLTFAQSARAEPGRIAGIDAQLATMLLDYVELFGEPASDGTRIALQCTQGQLAMAIGASERQVQRLFREWKAAGVVTKRGDGLCGARPRALARARWCAQWDLDSPVSANALAASFPQSR